MEMILPIVLTFVGIGIVLLILFAYLDSIERKVTRLVELQEKALSDWEPLR